MHPVRVAYTLEQCWHDVPGGTAVAALRVAEELAARPEVELVGVAGRHRRPPADPYRPAIPVASLPIGRPWLYETWLRWSWPRVESVTGPVEVCHATALVPAATTAPLVVTVHDLAFVRTPERFSRHGVRVMTKSLRRIRARADLVVCPSTATMQDLVDAGIGADRLRHVPLGVDPVPVSLADRRRVRARHQLPDRFVLFVGTLEPRKNLVRLAHAVAMLDDPLPLVVAGAAGWGGTRADLARQAGDVRFLGFVGTTDLAALYEEAAVVAYPSEWEGFGLPVVEAMAHGAPVVTSRGTATEEVAGGAAVLVDPLDSADIARGLAEAVSDRQRLIEAGRERAGQLTWSSAAQATLDAYLEVAGR